MKRYLLYALLLLLPQITHTTPIDGQTLWALSARICAEADESLSKLCVIDSTLDNLNFDLDIEEVICSKIDELEDCFMITQEDIDAGFTISSPGKYCLVENVTHTSANTAITIAADNVTLDLGGHTIDGENTATNGILINNTRENITIQNGTVTSCTSTGIFIENTTRLCIANITSVDSLLGIFIDICTNVFIKNCIIKNNSSGVIIRTVTNGTIKKCISQNNNAAGFYINACNNTIILNCKAINNSTNGFLLRFSSDNVTICRCLAVNNNNNGFAISESTNTSLINNKSIGNAIFGFIASSSPTTSAFANLAHSNGTNYIGITDPIETTVDTTTSY